MEPCQNYPNLLLLEWKELLYTDQIVLENAQ